jgi:hypothetical protein
MAARANSAALNAALNTYVRNGGYKNLRNALINYVIPRNYRNEEKQYKEQKKFSRRGMTEINSIRANLNNQSNFIMSLIRRGVSSARPTKKQRANAAAENARRRKATNVIKKAYIKSKLPSAQKVRARRLREASQALNQERRAAALAARFGARSSQLKNNRSTAGTLKTSVIGKGYKLSKEAKLAPAGGKHRNNVHAKNKNRAQQPETLFSAPALRGNNLRAAQARVQETTVLSPAAQLQALMGNRNAAPPLSSAASATLAATVSREVTAPRARPPPPSARNRLLKRTKTLGKK